MKEYMQKYIEQVNEINSLMERSGEIADDEDVIGYIRKRSEHVFHLMQSNDEIIQREIRPQLAENRVLTEAEFAELDAFSNEICSMAQAIDIGLAYLIHRKLLAVAEAEENLDQILEQQYALGIASFLLYSEYEMFDSIDVREKVVPWFHKVALHLDEFEELSHEARGYVLRSMNNEALIFNSRRYDRLDEYMQTIRHTLSVFKSEKVRALEPDINWTAFVRAVYHNCLRIADSIEQGYGTQYIPDVREAADWLERLKPHDIEISAIDQYSTLELANIFHEITDAECVARMQEMYTNREPLRFDRKGIDENINIPSFSLIYEARLEPVNLERINEKVQSIIQYVNAFHKETGLYSYHYAVSNFIRYYPEVEHTIPFRYVLEHLLRALHVPTYVHSRMVSNIAVMIGRLILQAAPELFAGCGSIRSADEAKAKEQQIMDFIQYAGLFHDVGKFYCMDVITQYSRRLFENEFDVIKLHAECGYKILSGHASTAPYAEAALMHHISYDRHGGYAREYMSEDERISVITDIIRIADAIDAATDSIGRCYSSGKNQEAVMQELTEAPTSYNPTIVGLLNGKKAQEQLRHLLSEERNKVYVEAYSDRAE